MSFRDTIENADIQKLPSLEFRGKIHLITNEEQQERAAAKLRNYEALGFDTEAKPSFKKGVIHPVSLLQLATEDEAFLIRINKTKPIPGILKILESEEILKIGVAITDDITDLRKIRDFMPGGFLALEQFVKQAGIQSNGLRKLAAITLNGRISKSAQVSNWEAPKLTAKQMAYAATDAWVGLKIYNELVEKGYFEHP